MIRQINPQGWNRLLRPLGKLVPGERGSNLGDRIHKGADILESKSIAEIYRLLVTHWHHPEDLILDASEPGTVFTDPKLQPHADQFMHEIMALDLITYLPDDILTKVDRAAMSVSLETRIPFLDHNIVEFAWRLPLSLKIKDGQGKWILRQLLYRHVPQKLIDRPKMGFGVPIGSWLRGPLREWAEALLSETRLRNEGYLNPEPIRRKWTEHLSGQRNWQYHLWDILMFQAWLEATQ
jgi:asparagine synthase (glutamine-hydrolysing)